MVELADDLVELAGAKRRVLDQLVARTGDELLDVIDAGLVQAGQRGWTEPQVGDAHGDPRLRWR